MYAASMVNKAQGGAGKDNIAREFHIPDRRRLGLRIFQPPALFQYISSDGGSDAKRISAHLPSAWTRRGAFRKQRFRNANWRRVDSLRLRSDPTPVQLYLFARN